MITRSLKFALFLLPFVQQGGVVFASEEEVNTITNQEKQQYQNDDLQPYHLEQVNEAFGKAINADLKAKIDEECYKFPCEFKFDIDKDDWIDTLVNLHYSNVRTRNAAKNRINKDNIGKWTYEYPKHLDVAGSMEAMKNLIKQALTHPDVQYSVNNDSEFLGAAFFEIAKAVNQKYAKFLKTYSTEPFLTYDEYFVNDIFNETVKKTHWSFGQLDKQQHLFNDLCYYISDFRMLDLFQQVFLGANCLDIASGDQTSKFSRKKIAAVEHVGSGVVLWFSKSKADLPIKNKEGLAISANAQGHLTALTVTVKGSTAKVAERPLIPFGEYQPVVPKDVYRGAKPTQRRILSWDQIADGRRREGNRLLADISKAADEHIYAVYDKIYDTPSNSQAGAEEIFNVVIQCAYNGVYLQNIAENVFLRKSTDLYNDGDSGEYGMRKMIEYFEYKPANLRRKVGNIVGREDPDLERVEAAYEWYKEILTDTIEETYSTVHGCNKKTPSWKSAFSESLGLNGWKW